MRPCSLLRLAAAVALASAFSPQPSRELRGNNNVRPRSIRPATRSGDDGGQHNIDGRRHFLSTISAASAPFLLGVRPSAAAQTNDPTRVELTVDSEYLIRVLDYFDGDLRKSLGVLARAPQTTVEIDPPARGWDPSVSPRDAILRALDGSEENAEARDKWLKVDEPATRGVVRPLYKFLTKRRYRIYLPMLESSGARRRIEGADGLEVEYGDVEVVIKPSNVNLSNLEVAAGVTAVSYPLAYGYYNYQSYREEEAAKLKKAKMAAKRAAKAKAKGKSEGKSKAKGSTKNKKTEGKADAKKDVKATKGKDAGKEKTKKVIKGQETKQVEAKSTVVKKGTTVAKDADVEINDRAAAEMLDSQRKGATSAAKKQQATDELAAEILDSTRNGHAGTTAATDAVVKVEDHAAAEMLDSRRKGATTAAKKRQAVDEAAAEMLDSTRKSHGASMGGYLNGLSQGDDPRPTGADTRGRGSFGGYLDSL